MSRLLDKLNETSIEKRSSNLTKKLNKKTCLTNQLDSAKYKRNNLRKKNEKVIHKQSRQKYPYVLLFHSISSFFLNYFVVYLFVCFLFKIYFILFVFFHYHTILFFIIVLFFKFLYPILLLFFCSESIFLLS